MEENDVYNEFNIDERKINESNADPSVFFKSTGNPFLGFMHFLKRKPVPPKQVDEQKLMYELLGLAGKQQINIRKSTVIIYIVAALLFSLLIFITTGISIEKTLGVLIFLSVFILMIVVGIKNNKILFNRYYTQEDYNNYIIQKAVSDEVNEFIYEPNFGLPYSIYKDLNVINQECHYDNKNLITGKYKNIYFAQSDLKVVNNHITYFKGKWIGIDYPKKFNGTVVIMDNSFTYGVERNDLEKIQLNNPDFNNIFTVSASDMQLGYYLLTPQLMEKFMELRQNSRGHIIACFKDGYIHIFINDGKDSFEQSVLDENIMFDVEKFKRDFTAVSGTIDVLDVNNSVYTQSNAQPFAQTPYQSYSNPTPPNNNSGSGVGIQGERF